MQPVNHLPEGLGAGLPCFWADKGSAQEPDKDAHEVQADSGSSAYTAGLGMPHNLPQLT